MYFHLDLCNDCYVCIFFIVCGLHTHTKLEVLVQHIHHTVFVFFLCVRLFLFFCTYLLTLPKLKHGHWQCTMHTDYNFKNKSDQHHQHQQQLKYVSSVKQDCMKKQFFRTLAFGIGYYEYVLHICWCQPS